jgi:uncharacterized protein
MKIERVVATQAALDLIGELRQEFGDGSAPMCFVDGDFKLGATDVHLGEIGGCPFYMGSAQFEYWSHTQLIIDVVKGRGASFSLEIPRGVRFLTRSRVFTDEEAAALDPVRRA